MSRIITLSVIISLLLCHFPQPVVAGNSFAVFDTPQSESSAPSQSDLRIRKLAIERQELQDTTPTRPAPSTGVEATSPEEQRPPQQLPVKLPPPTSIEIDHTWQIDPAWENATYSFSTEEFINPKIVEAMQGPLADTGSNIASINIKKANLSNQFFSEMHVRSTPNEYPYVYFAEGGTEYGYRFIGATSTGIQIVHTIAHYGGSGAFHTVLFFIYTITNKIVFDTNITVQPEQGITLIGSIPLGDRFSGTIEFSDDVLKLLPQKGDGQPIPLYKGGIILSFD